MNKNIKTAAIVTPNLDEKTTVKQALERFCLVKALFSTKHLTPRDIKNIVTAYIRHEKIRIDNLSYDQYSKKYHARGKSHEELRQYINQKIWGVYAFTRHE